MANKTDTLVIFDLDDTLIDTNAIYHGMRYGFINHSAFKDLGKENIKNRYDKKDAELIKAWDHSTLRHKMVMFSVYTDLKNEGLLKERSPELEWDLNNLGNGILQGPTPKILPGAIELVSGLKDYCTQIIVTRGDHKPQHRKINGQGLAQHFNDISVVPVKNAEVYLNEITKRGFSPEQAWIIGDSKKSDIEPALKIGANAIHFQFKKEAGSWEKTNDRSEIKSGYLTAQSLKEVKEILEVELGMKPKPIRNFYTQHVIKKT